MLEIRLSCEHCNKPLPNTSNEAMICTYECTFCQNCVTEILKNVCPNCGGGFEKRPTRPIAELIKNPPRKDKVYKPVNFKRFFQLLKKNKNIEPRNR